MKNHINNALKILTKVYADGTYANIAFYDGESSDMTMRLVYGTLEKNIQIDYILSKVVEKPPRGTVKTLLKIGIYALLNLDSVPDYAIVSECVEVAKLNNKKELSGFVNAVLKRVARREYKLPDKNSKNYLSITYSKPQWFIDKMIAEYGIDKTVAVISAPPYDLEHARVNLKKTTLNAVKNSLFAESLTFEQSAAGGLILSASPEVNQMFLTGLITFQSPSSMYAVDALAPADGARILDICSAPGGKAVYMAEKCPGSTIVACDIHKHRLELIEKYKKRMGTKNINTVLADATVFKPEWENSFDYVLVDAPCSCLGTFRKHPDVFLQRGEEDIAKLVEIQKSILLNAMRYVAAGGVLVYSTCTLFKAENGDVVDFALNENSQFVLEKMPLPIKNEGKAQILPKEEWDGFFIARLRKAGN